MLTRRTFLFGAAALAQTSKPPNIIFILADDLGYGDLGCYNARSKIPTPNLDRLAAQGIRFTDAHTPSAVCTPTRYGLMTGRYSWRTRLKLGVLDGFDPPLIEPGRQTIATMLKANRYTTMCIGKWHLGMEWTTKDGSTMPDRVVANGFRPGDEVDYTKALKGGPNDCGFDSYFGISASLDMPPYAYIENRKVTELPTERANEDKSLVMNQPPGMKAKNFSLNGVLPALTARAVEFVEKATPPYFLYMPLSAPHLPVVPNKEYQGKSQAGAYGDFVVEMDACVGRVLDAIKRSGQEQNTLVMFSSDNGGLWHWWKYENEDDTNLGKPTPRSSLEKELGHQSNGSWRGTKADIWECGHRVPLIAKWPAGVRAGQVSDHLICLTDVIATCAEVSGAPFKPATDSVSFAHALTGRGKRQSRGDIVHHSHRGLFAIRMGDWKYVVERGSGGFSAPVRIPGATDGQLFNLKNDPRETQNVFAQNPEIVARLAKRLEAIQRVE
jgi:arylsulfatase A-like enzyme